MLIAVSYGIEIPTTNLMFLRPRRARRNSLQAIDTGNDNLAAKNGNIFYLLNYDSQDQNLAITWAHFPCAGYSRKPQNCYWNFDFACHCSRDISISGFGGHIVISDCRSFSECVAWGHILQAHRNRLEFPHTA